MLERATLWSGVRRAECIHRPAERETHGVVANRRLAVLVRHVVTLAVLGLVLRLTSDIRIRGCGCVDVAHPYSMVA